MTTAEELTPEQAKALAASGFWKKMTHRERAEFQLRTPLLCMPFDVFHEAVEKALRHPVWTHQFAKRRLAELCGDVSAPTFAEVLAMIPADKRIVVVAPPPSEEVGGG